MAAARWWRPISPRAIFTCLRPRCFPRTAISRRPIPAGSSIHWYSIFLTPNQARPNCPCRNNRCGFTKLPKQLAFRDELGFYNPGLGCSIGQCGACPVHADRQAVRSCVMPVSAVGTRKMTTLTGVGTPEKPHPLQTAWREEEVNQVAYCINGCVM